MSLARRLTPVLLAASILSVAACAGDAASSSFDPASACNGAARQQMSGAYPDLESRIPTSFQGQAPVQRDSGRFCAKETLGSLWDVGIREAQFGGAAWPLGEKAGGVQLTVFRAPGLTVQGLADEYRQSAAGNRSVTIVSATTQVVAGRNGFRLDLLNGESRQAVVIWPSADGAVVQVVVAADVDESAVQAGIAALR